MTRTSATSKSAADGIGHSDGGADERPFAEIRRVVFDGLRLFSLHRWMFFVPFCLVSCGAFIGSFYLPRTFEATTNFEVRNDPVMSNLPVSAGAASYKYFRNTMVRDLTSAETMSEAVEKLGLLADLERNAEGDLTESSARKRDSLARMLGSKLTITVNSPSELIDVVRITYTGEDPALGRKLVDEVKRSYIRRTGAWIYDFLVQQRDYFKREVEDAAAEVMRAQREETALRLENPFVNPADPGSVSVRIAQLEAERRDLMLRKREYETELSAQKQLLISTQPEGARARIASEGSEPMPTLNPTLLSLAARIQELDQKVAELRRTRGMTDEHPEIADLMTRRGFLHEELIRQQEAEAAGESVDQGEVVSAATMSPSNVMPAPTGEHARLALQIAAWTDKIKELDIALQTNEFALDQLQQAKDQVFEKQEEFAAVIGRVQKAKTRQNQLEGTLAQIEPSIKAVAQNRLLHFSEGSPAYGGYVPISPKGQMVVLLALAAGIAAGVLFVILSEVMDHVFRSSSQVARSLGLPLLEAIDEIVTVHDRRKMLIMHAVITPVLVIVCLGAIGLTGSIAYLSLAKPATYEKVRHIPESVLKLFIETREAEAHPAKSQSDEA